MYACSTSLGTIWHILTLVPWQRFCKSPGGRGREHFESALMTNIVWAQRYMQLLELQWVMPFPIPVNQVFTSPLLLPSYLSLPISTLIFSSLAQAKTGQQRKASEYYLNGFVGLSLHCTLSQTLSGI